MRISELSRRSGVPVPTLRFYIREGLLPPGTPTARNQADYDERHLRRLRLIRALTAIGGLELWVVRELIAGIDDPSVTTPAIYKKLDEIRFPLEDVDLPGSEGVDHARVEISALTDQLGWDGDSTRSGRETLARILAALRTLGCDADVEFFLPFVRAAETIVEAERALLDDTPEGDEKAAPLVRTVLFDAMMSALLWTARQRMVVERFPEASLGARGPGS